MAADMYLPKWAKFNSSPLRVARYALPSIACGVSELASGCSGDCRRLTSNDARARTARPSATSNTSTVRCCCRRSTFVLSCAT